MALHGGTSGNDDEGMRLMRASLDERFNSRSMVAWRVISGTNIKEQARLLRDFLSRVAESDESRVDGAVVGLQMNNNYLSDFIHHSATLGGVSGPRWARMSQVAVTWKLFFKISMGGHQY